MSTLVILVFYVTGDKEFVLELSAKEDIMLGLIYEVLDGATTVEQAANKAGVCTRTIRRNIDKYVQYGTHGLVHKSRGRVAHNRTDAVLRKQIVSLYLEYYSGYNFTHFYQKLTEVEDIYISYPTVYYALKEQGLRSPKAHRRAKKVSHPLRPRRQCFGELVQMDASLHFWIEGEKWTLHAAIDDATSEVLGAHFELQETLHGYYCVMAQILKNYGVPEEFYTDKRTVFASKNTQTSKLEHDITTQFRVAAAKLGVLEIHTSSVPQAKGRVERLFNTFQDRLISEMRSAKISSLAQANAFVGEFIKDHNARYAQDSTVLPSAFGTKLNDTEINISLSVINERKIQPGNYISFKGKKYGAFSKRGMIPIPVGKQVFVLKTLDEKLYLTYEDEFLPLLQIPDIRYPTPAELAENLYIPPKNHPWKEKNYEMMLRKLRRVS